MQKCKVKNITKNESFCYIVLDSKNVFKTIMLPNKVADKLKIGDTVRVLQDKQFGIEDYVYLYKGGMNFHTKPLSYDQYSCKNYVDNLPGLFDKDGDLDRLVFKFVIARECYRRGFMPTFSAWRNLRNVLLWDTFSHLVR